MKLKPCPFCGSDNARIVVENKADGGHGGGAHDECYISCVCAIRTKTFSNYWANKTLEDIKTEAVNAWNDRPEVQQ